MDPDFLIFTPGPVKMPEIVLAEGAKQLPYFRTKQFSKIITECNRMLKKSVNAPSGSECIFLSASGTGAMDAVIANLFGKTDSVLTINSGTFGKRFCEILDFYSIKNEEILVKSGSSITYDHLCSVPVRTKTALLINGHETSTGALHDIKMVGEICHKNKLLYIVDAISMYLADSIDMQKQNIDVLILSSQKGLALPPGLSIVILSKSAQNLLQSVNLRSYYFDFNKYLSNLIAGQTPFTPPISIILQLYKRLIQIDEMGGADELIKNTEMVANYFRDKIKGLPLKIYAEHPSNALTALTPLDNKNAKEIVLDFERLYNIYLCPNGGNLEKTVFRVSHLGDINIPYTEKLIEKMKLYYRMS
jgi:aspartate aminotransferase-like enzyme